jgi:hypothetical protein
VDIPVKLKPVDNNTMHYWLPEIPCIFFVVSPMVLPIGLKSGEQMTMKLGKGPTDYYTNGMKLLNVTTTMVQL